MKKGAGAKASAFFLLVFKPMIISKITSKARTTIPRPVLVALRLKEGDEITYMIEDRRVILTRARSNNADDQFATSTNGTVRPIGRPMDGFEQRGAIRVGGSSFQNCHDRDASCDRTGPARA
jgi:antitoxin PrlF